MLRINWMVPLNLPPTELEMHGMQNWILAAMLSAEVALRVGKTTYS